MPDRRQPKRVSCSSKVMRVYPNCAVSTSVRSVANIITAAGGAGILVEIEQANEAEPRRA